MSEIKMRTCRYCKKTLDLSVFTGDKRTCNPCRGRSIRKDIAISPEQKRIIDSVLQRENVVVNSKAGTGKTTTGLACATEFIQKYGENVLYLTYNKRLNGENREKIAERELEQFIFGHNYHSCAKKWFNKSSRIDDTVISDSLSLPLTERYEDDIDTPVGLVIVDEAQDMAFLYKKFVVHILSELEKRHKIKPILLLMGDPFQCIYQFRSASIEFMVNPKKHFGRDFKLHSMNKSWRVPLKVAEWINENLSPLKLERHRSEWWNAPCSNAEFGTNGNMVKTIWGNGIEGNDISNGSVHIVSSRDGLGFVENFYKGVSPEQIIMLGQSPKNYTIQQITNNLKNIPWFVDDSKDDQVNTEEHGKGKYHITTIHKFKGLEKEFVVFSGFGGYLEKYEEQNGVIDPLKIYNLCYTACTRTMKKLILMVDKPLYLTMREEVKERENLPCKNISVRELVEYTAYDDKLDNNLFEIEELYPEDTEEIPWDSEIYDIKGNSEYKNTIECIADIIAQAVNLEVEVRINPKTNRKFLAEFYIERTEDDPKFLNKIKQYALGLDNWILQHKADSWVEKTWQDKLLYALAIEAICTGFFYKWRQISHLTVSKKLEKVLEGLVKNTIAILECLGERVEVENRIHIPISPESRITSYRGVSGRIDYFLDGKVIVESKISEKVDNAHCLQAQCYSSMKLLEGKLKKIETYVIYPNIGKILHLKSIDYGEKLLFYRLLWRKVFVTLDEDKDAEMVEEFRKLYGKTEKKPRKN